MSKHFFCISFCMVSIFSYLSAERPPENPNNFVINRFSHEEMAALPKYRELECIDPGFSKAIIEFKGFPIEKKLMISLKRLVQNNENDYKTIGSIKFTKDGRWISNGSEIYSCYPISSRGFLPGERIFFRVQTDAGSFRKEISLIPNPLVAISQRNEFSLEAELTILSPAFYTIRVKGLEDSEEIQFISESLNEKIQKEVPASSLKVFLTSFDVTNENRGIGTLTLVRKNGDSLTARFPWGEIFTEYLKGNDPLK
jgi:hypothetical protein